MGPKFVGRFIKVFRYSCASKTPHDSTTKGKWKKQKPLREVWSHPLGAKEGEEEEEEEAKVNS